MSDTTQTSKLGSELPTGWSQQRLGVWGCKESEIRLSVHQSKVTRCFTASATSGDYFLSCCLIGDLPLAIAEAGELGTLLRTRLARRPCVDSAVI